jgi:hypothetical protein
MPDIFITMIKQNWNISTDEAKRILMMHEGATKNLYLVNEQRQEVVTTTEKQENKFPLTNLGDKFEYGKYDSPTVKQAIEQLKPQIEEFIKKSDSSNFTINISAGESQVTNPKGFETKGSLALARANSVKKYFEELFPDLIKRGVLVIKSPSSVDGVKIGETPYGGPGSGDFKKPEKKTLYDQEQFVNFDLIGSGSKIVTTTKTKTFCNTKPLDSEGGSLSADANFTQVIPWNIGAGEGILQLGFDTYYMPDIIYVEYNGKTYGDTFFRGRGRTADYRIFVGTALYAKYGQSGLPKQMSQNQITKLDYNDFRLKDALPEMRAWTLVESFNNTFGPDSSLSNPAYMDAFRRFDQKKGNDGVNRLLKELGPDFPWAILTTKIPDTTTFKIGPIPKVDGVDTINVINVAPVGTTKWELKVSCK